MKLLTFGDYSVVIIWNDDEWIVAHVFRHLPGVIEAEPASVSQLSWQARMHLAELLGDPMP